MGGEVDYIERQIGPWGSLGAKSKGLTVYTLSPMEQRAFAKAFTKGVQNNVRIYTGNFLSLLPGLVALVAIYNWGNSEHQRLGRKDPAHYEHEQ